ncbi:HAD-superfamily hydrolase, subfamily IB [Campylobacter avium LMG 24591]|uniref:HAD-superfamily hydrolase, subfamily IB n=1 Tax=Campylobacter avium LMG 24591 TaxID=522484 RepID=A0A222MVP9_9BACT|nr:HAD-IB family hydrolase [Campylobacter avium]ASQ29975.1 HAD-superfamily hydrolase, subfamily IB [Campylobacter avium LMG 24591]OYD79074.1 HAD-superfamily hydrolase, subfamily IB [Campylobacter avium]
MSKKILALFDFCETLINFQSLDRYLQLAALENVHCNEAENIARRQSFANANMPYPRYEALIDFDIQKATSLAKNFVFGDILAGINQRVLDKLFFHQDRGDEIVIVSGGLSIYINEFAKIYGVTNIVAVDLEVVSNKLTGNIDGIHTMQERKLYKLAQTFDLNEYDLKDSYVYSDCVSDIPLLSLVGNARVVSCGKDLKWAKILRFEIL